ncbi:MAG: GlsB/YeaQ/YmgE family stress response membrane protein [Porphyrobacter sp.]|nr:GlsB/YeaQ/YmgE family stress response membrane protein [Porphyrobacter sp.]
MGLLFMIVVGAILGWLAAIVLKIEAPRGILLNMAAGVVGALLMGLFIGPLLLGSASLLSGYYYVDSLLLSLVGSLIVIAGLNVYMRGQLR